ncbi:MAG: ABC transporter ATP-binding protein [Betaproteobacteria bacterium]
MAAPLLEVDRLEVSYGGVRAVRGVSFFVDEAETVCLIGANGAGKSSSLRAIARLVASRGSVRYAGDAIERLPAHALAGRGLALVPEGRGVFARLSVRENLLMGRYARRDALGGDLDRIYAHMPRLAERAHQLAGTLSGGEQQLLAIGRALMSRPRLLLLDEPSMGLAPLMVAKVYQVLAEIAAEGVAMLLVEQNARQALAVSHRAYVMESGELTLSGPAAELAGDARVRAAYLGGD